MKIFVAWAGGRSHRAAQAIGDWLTALFSDVEAWLSPQIGKGDDWFAAVHENLNAAHLGVAVVTADYVYRSDWLHYEVGYLRGRSRPVFPFLLDLRSQDLRYSPLARLQHTVFSRDDLWSLCSQINNLRDEEVRHSSQALREIFESGFASVEDSLNGARSMAPTTTESDLLLQILARVTQIQRSIFHAANSGDSVMSRGLNDYEAPHVATMEEIVRFFRDPDSYKLPEWSNNP